MKKTGQKAPRRSTGKIQERRWRSQRLIKNLVTSRAEMLSLYTQLGTRLREANGEMLSGLLEKFCQELIDYTANAHFQLYRFIGERRERRRAVLDIAEETYPSILQSTEQILDFNDKYDIQHGTGDVDELKQDLSNLGETLAFRIDLEDRLIQELSRPRG